MNKTIGKNMNKQITFNLKDRNSTEFGQDENPSGFDQDNNSSELSQEKIPSGFDQDKISSGFSQDENTSGFGQENNTSEIGEDKNTSEVNQDNYSYEFGQNKIVIREPAFPVLYLPERESKIDEKCISKKYYNSFNFSKLASTFKDSKMTIGVTSASRRDGKTLVAANMAVSLASGYNQKTVLVDMSFGNPDLHRVFGKDLTPGLSDAIASEEIRVLPSGIKNLFVMTAGSSKDLTPGIEHTLILRQILFALKSKFDFVIIDMGPIIPISRFPIHFINEIDGLIGVIDSQKTKRKEFNKIFKHVDESQFIGYVFNRVDS